MDPPQDPPPGSTLGTHTLPPSTCIVLYTGVLTSRRPCAIYRARVSAPCTCTHTHHMNIAASILYHISPPATRTLCPRTVHVTSRSRLCSHAHAPQGGGKCIGSRILPSSRSKDPTPPTWRAGGGRVGQHAGHGPTKHKNNLVDMGPPNAARTTFWATEANRNAKTTPQNHNTFR